MSYEGTNRRPPKPLVLEPAPDLDPGVTKVQENCREDGFLAAHE
jgi:hypothetical protein